MFKVNGNMFALVPLDSSPARMNLMFDPALAAEQRACYPSERHAGRHLAHVHVNAEHTACTREMAV